VDVLNAMATQCPNSVIVAGGYSQGAAVSHRAIESLDPAVKNQIAGVVLYGDTQNTQDRGQIPNFDPAKTKVICAPGDAVCKGTLVILPAHLSYGANADEGASFLNQQILAAKTAKGTARKAKKRAETIAERLDKLAFEVAA